MTFPTAPIRPVSKDPSVGHLTMKESHSELQKILNFLISTLLLCEVALMPPQCSRQSSKGAEGICPMLSVSVRSIVQTMNRDTKNETNPRPNERKSTLKTKADICGLDQSQTPFIWSLEALKCQRLCTVGALHPSAGLSGPCSCQVLECLPDPCNQSLPANMPRLAGLFQKNQKNWIFGGFHIPEVVRDIKGKLKVNKERDR